jgi:hypothetical protein
MRAGWRLALNVWAWTAAIPGLSVGLRVLVEHRILSASGNVGAVATTVLLLWACLIYWRCVPSAADVLHRVGYLVAFLTLMLVLGAGALWVTFWIIIAIYGL